MCSFQRASLNQGLFAAKDLWPEMSTIYFVETCIDPQPNASNIQEMADDLVAFEELMPWYDLAFLLLGRNEVL